MSIYVLYHSNCMDGMGAAYVAHQYFSEQEEIKEIKYIPVQYGKPFPEVPLCEMSEVYILDFSYSRDILDEVYAKVGKLVVLDHHKTAQEALQGAEYAQFDMGKSGATLAWGYFYPGKEIPDLISYIEDRDLWKFKLPGTKSIFSALVNRGAMNQAFNKEDSLFSNYIEKEYDKGGFNDLIKEGELLDSYRESLLGGLANPKSKKLFFCELLGKKLAVFNTTEFISESGHTVYDNHEVDVSMSFFLTRDLEWVFSLRSKTPEHDTSAISKTFGGGGHACASAFKMDMETGSKFLKGLRESGSVYL